MADHPTSGMIELLAEEKLLSKKQMKQLSKEVGRTDRSTVEIIIDKEMLSANEITEFIDALGIEHIVPDAVEIDWDAIRKIGHDRAQTEAILPIITSSHEKEIAVPDPLDSALSTELAEILDKSVVLVFALPGEIRNVLNSVSTEGVTSQPIEKDPDFTSFIADETSYKAVEILRTFTNDRAQWNKPILLVGNGCVGKTHLIKAARQAITVSFPELNIVFAEGQAIMDDPVILGRDHIPEGFLLDGLEYIAGDPRAEEIFMQVFNAVFQQRGPIIVTAAAALSSITELSMRVKASLAICRTVNLGNPRPETQEAIGRQLCARLDIDPDGIDWVALISEARGDLRKIIEALESGKVARAAASQEIREPLSSPQPKPAIPNGQSTMADTLREEAEAIIEEARLAIEEIELTVPSQADEILSEARKTFEEAIQAIDAGDFVRSEQLGMEALEKAAVAHGQAEKIETIEDAVAEDVVVTQKEARKKQQTEADARTAIDEAERAIREACDMGAEEYASKELRVALNGLEEARRLLEKEKQITQSIDEARLSMEQARDASRRARTRKEEARIKQEKEKIRRCQLAIDEARMEFDQLMTSEGDTPIAKQLEEVEVFIETAVQYQEVGNIGQALEHVMKARKRLADIGQEAGQRRELREIINEVDAMVREADGAGEGRTQQLVDIQSALAEAERVLMGDSQDYELGLNWARVARQKAIRLTEAQSERRPVEAVPSADNRTSEQTFETYDICEANQFVAAIARTAAETPHLVKSPLFIHGEVGVGKTHLLAAIYDLAERTHPEKKTLFMTSSDFVDEYREAAARSEASLFRERLRNLNLLVIDDLHRIIGDREGLLEFFHTVSAIEAHGGLVVVSSAYPPRRLEVDDKSFRSRLEGGVIAEVKNPSLNAREKILRREARRYDLAIPEEAINLLATMITTNVRDLIGALGKVAARSRAARGPVTGDIIRTVLRDVLPAANEGDTWHLS